MKGALQRFILKLAQARAGKWGAASRGRWPWWDAFMAVHKFALGAAFSSIAGWTLYGTELGKCPQLLGHDVLVLLHIPLSCEVLGAIAGILGVACLCAGGVSPDDAFRMFKRERAINEGTATCVEPDKAIVTPLPPPQPAPPRDPMLNR